MEVAEAPPVVDAGAMAVVMVAARVAAAVVAVVTPCQPVPTSPRTEILTTQVAGKKCSHAATCQPLNKLCAAPANAQRVVTVAAMAVVTAARHRHRALADSPTRCAPAST